MVSNQSPSTLYTIVNGQLTLVASLLAGPSGTLIITPTASGGGGSYTLPVATATILGGVKQGSGVTIAGDGTLSASGGGASPWAVKTTTYTAVAGDRIQADTTGAAFTITLPASASVGDSIQIEDAELSWNTNNLTLAYNGLKINGLSSNYTASVQGNKLSIVYISSGYGWSIK